LSLDDAKDIQALPVKIERQCSGAIWVVRITEKKETGQE